MLFEFFPFSLYLIQELLEKSRETLPFSRTRGRKIPGKREHWMRKELLDTRNKSRVSSIST
jgi:hypothetical protein